MRKIFLITLALVFSFSFQSEVHAQRVKKTKVQTKRGTVTRTKVKNRNGKTVAVKTTVRRTPHARYTHLPRRNVVVKSRPAGARRVVFGKRKYWFNDGVYYYRTAAGYRVVRPRRGLRITMTTLPVGHRRIVVRGVPYVYYYGTYYKTSPNNKNEYEVVDAPVEAKVDALPEGYETVVEEGQTFYVLDGVYYKEVPLDENGDEWGYEVVKVTEVDYNDEDMIDDEGE